MRYTIVEEDDIEKLEKKVQALIDEGWEPQGVVSAMTYAVGTSWYYQALIKR